MTRMHFGCLLAAALALLSPAQAQAQAVWRCGEGGRSYSESPCPGGRQVNTADPRQAAEVQAARETVKRSQDLAKRMRDQRLEDERRHLAANAGPANLGPTQAAAKAPDKLKPKSKRKAQHRQQPAAAAAGGTWPATAAASRRKKD